jgi:hypothetical protein
MGGFISLYTCVKDALYWDLHAEAMLRHHLPLADEIIVNEGYSTDGTFERISQIDPKIKIFRSHWQEPSSLDWYQSFKDPARRQCTGQWCIHLDCDEFIPEWEFEGLKKRLERTRDDLLWISMLNFYGNYKVYHSDPAASHWPARKMVIHRNRPDIEFWGDGSNVRIATQDFQWPAEEAAANVHHFGFVRNPARLREKWRNQQGRVYGTGRLLIPAFLFRLFPHRWQDREFETYLRVYEGQPIAAVRDDPDEFVRDDFTTYRMLTGTRPADPSRAPSLS